MNKKQKKPNAAGETWEADGWIVLTVRPSTFFVDGWECLVLACPRRSKSGRVDDFAVHMGNGFKRIA